MIRGPWLSLPACFLLVGCSAPRMEVPGGACRCGPDPLMPSEGAVPVSVRVRKGAPSAIDGLLDDPCWAGTEWHGGDRFFSACFDDRFLYVSVSSSASAPDGRAAGPGERRDGAVESGDAIVLRLQPFDRQELFFDVFVAPDATVADRRMAWTPWGVSRYQQGFHVAGLRTGSVVQGGRWTVELAVPWDGLWMSPPSGGRGARMGFQVAARRAGASDWRSWGARSCHLDEPASRFDVMEFGDVVPPWRVLHAEPVRGAAGPLLAIAMARGPGGPEEGTLVVDGEFSGGGAVRLDRTVNRMLLPIAVAGPARRQDGHRAYRVRALVGGRSWDLGGWSHADPTGPGAGTMVVPGVGGGLADAPVENSGLSLAAVAVPRGRRAVDLRMRPIAPGQAPWHVLVRSHGEVVLDAMVPGLPALAAVPVMGLPQGAHVLDVELTGALGGPVLSARLPIEITAGPEPLP